MIAGSPASTVQTTRLSGALCSQGFDSEGSVIVKQRAEVKRAARRSVWRVMTRLVDGNRPR